MKDINKIKNYKIKYEKYYCIKIPKGFNIHHIDFNHDNNDINNLIMIPSKLHQNYHRQIDILIEQTKDKISNIKINKSNCFIVSENLIKLGNILIEMTKWLNERDIMKLKNEGVIKGE